MGWNGSEWTSDGPTGPANSMGSDEFQRQAALPPEQRSPDWYTQNSYNSPQDQEKWNNWGNNQQVSNMTAGPNGGLTTTNGNGSFHTSWGSTPDTPAAQYGNSHPGGMGAILGDYDALGGTNQWAQDSLNSGASYADSLARKAQNRGPSAREDSGLAWNEAGGAGGNQDAALGLAGTLARGQQPSQAAYQLQSGLNANMAQQSAIARGARGGAALAVAGQNEAFNNATAQQNAFTQGGLLRSRDMATGRGLLGSQLDTMQRQNATRIGQADQLNQFNAAQNDKVGLGMAGAAVNLGNAATNAGSQNLNIQKGKDAITDQQNTADQQAQVWEGKKRKNEVAAWNGQ